MWKALIFMILILIVPGCEIDPVDMNKVERQVDFRLKERELNKIRECRQRAMLDAETHVDSIITDITRNSIFNDMFFPERPDRDTTDTLYEIELDTVSIKTLLDIKMRSD